MIFIFAFVKCKWPKRCCQAEEYSSYCCRTVFPLLSCLAELCKILSSVPLATHFLLPFPEGKITLFHEALRVDMTLCFMLTVLYRSIKRVGFGFFVTKVIVYLAVICVILIQ